MDPTASWPTASPTRQAVRVSWTWAAPVWRSRASAGSPGRYMSSESGPKALRDPRMNTSRVRPAGACSPRLTSQVPTRQHHPRADLTEQAGSLGPSGLEVVAATTPEDAAEVHRLTQAAFAPYGSLDPPSGAVQETLHQG